MNQVILIGRVGKDPQFKDGLGKNRDNSMATFSVATSEYKGKDNSGKSQYDTDWHNIKCWGKMAEYCDQNVRKGDEVFIKGKIRSESWESNGQKHYATYAIPELIRVTKQGGQAGSNGNNSNDDSSPW